MSCHCPMVPCSKPHQGDEKPGPCLDEPPFWWLSQDTDRSPRNPDSGDLYTMLTDFKEVEKYDVVGEMKLNDAEEYTPGEIYQSQKQLLIPVTYQPFQGVQWIPKSPDFYTLFDINSVPPADNYLYNMVKKRQQLDLASTLKEDSDYSLKDGSEVAKVGRPVHAEVNQLQALTPGTILGQPKRRLCTEHFFCECHQHHSLPRPNSPKTIVCDKCGCEYNVIDLAMIESSRRIMAATSHIAGTNPYCFRDVIGRN